MIAQIIALTPKSKTGKGADIYIYEYDGEEPIGKKKYLGHHILNLDTYVKIQRCVGSSNVVPKMQIREKQNTMSL